MPQKMFRLSDEQVTKLKKISELRGCSQTDLIRDFIDSLDELSGAGRDTQGDTQEIHEQIHEQIHAERTPAEPIAGDSGAVAALARQLAVKDEQLAKKDEQIARLMDTVADGQKAVQGAQALHHETAQALAIESAGQKKAGRWARLKAAWRG